MSDGKVLFITGASSGIGAATARAAVAAGWRVGVMARSGDTLSEMVTTFGESRAMALPGDVTRRAEVEEAVDTLRKGFGRIDAIFANAGKGLSAAGMEKGDPDEWDHMIDLNIKGLLWTVKASWDALKESGGQAVLTGSVAGLVHIPGSVYGASKWFVRGFAGNLSEEMREFGGRCTVIHPGMVDTPFFDEAKPDKLQPEDIAAAVMYALEQPERADVRSVTVMPTG